MNFWNKKIPTGVGIILLVVAVLATSYLANTGVIFFGGAAPSDNPLDVRITNISNTGFTITYHTAAKVIGTVSLGTSGDNLTAILDERDQQSGIPKQYTLHSISVQKLTPQTTYLFSITSGTTTYQNNGTLFSAKTFSQITASPSATTPLTGKLVSLSGGNPDEALIFATTAHGQTLSTLAQSNGVYILPLNALRSQDGSSLLPLSSQSVIQVLATDGTSSSQAQLLISDDNPVPTITLGNSYNFVLNQEPIASTAASLGFPAFPQDSTLSATPIITTPKKDEGFSDSQPQFSGKGLPHESVSIEIHSDSPITATVTTDGSGNWTYRPTTPLSPGPHTISITTKNSAGILQTIEQSFVVYAAGSQVNQSATPSGQLSPTATPKPTISPKTSPSPTLAISPTVIPTITSTPTPTLQPSLPVKPRPTLPPTGSNTLLSASLMGIATTLVGIILFILTMGVM